PEDPPPAWSLTALPTCVPAAMLGAGCNDCRAKDGSVPGAATGRTGPALGSTTAGGQQRGGTAGAAPSAFGAPVAPPVGHRGLGPGCQAGPGPQGGCFPRWTTPWSRRSPVHWSRQPRHRGDASTLPPSP